jgi:hypothetical protein
MYNNKLAVAIKTAGKVLREKGDKVYLPFGSEYSIFIKNLNSVRALVRIELDGKSVTDGKELVVYGNSELNLERFLKNGNMNEGHRFKFIERSSKVEAHRGVGVEDGLLRVEFQFEKVKQPDPVVIKHEYHHHHDYFYPKKPWPWYHADTYYGSAGLNSSQIIGDVCSSQQVFTSNSMASSGLVGGKADSVVSATCSLNNAGLSSGLVSKSFAGSGKTMLRSASVKLDANEAGITVDGSISAQKFQDASWFPVETETHVIVLKLLGETEAGEVSEALIVQKKQTCPSCGTRNRGKNKFCRECGTNLEIVGQSAPRVQVR